MEPAADEGPLEEAQLEDRIVQLKRVLEEDVSLTPEEREAEIKKARIALMRRLRVGLFLFPLFFARAGRSSGGGEPPAEMGCVS